MAEIKNEKALKGLPKLETDMDIIAKLDDEPNDVGGLTSDQLKTEFDRAGNAIKTYVNEQLLPALEGTGPEDPGIVDEAVNAHNIDPEAHTDIREDITTIQDNATVLSGAVDAHIGSRANPHGVTAEQVGAATPEELNQKTDPLVIKVVTGALYTGGTVNYTGAEIKDAMSKGRSILINDPAGRGLFSAIQSESKWDSVLLSIDIGAVDNGLPSWNSIEVQNDSKAFTFVEGASLVYPVGYYEYGVIKADRAEKDDTQPVRVGFDSKLFTKPYILPQASASDLGGVKAAPATDEDTQPVNIGIDGKLYTKPGGAADYLVNWPGDVTLPNLGEKVEFDASGELRTQLMGLIPAYYNKNQTCKLVYVRDYRAIMTDLRVDELTATATFSLKSGELAITFPLDAYSIDLCTALRSAAPGAGTFATCYDAPASPTSEPSKWYIPKSMPVPSNMLGTIVDVFWKYGHDGGIGYDASLIWGEPGGADNETIVAGLPVSDPLTGEYSIPVEGTVRYQLASVSGRLRWQYVGGKLIPKQFSTDARADAVDKAVPGMEIEYLPGMEAYVQLDNGNTAEVMNFVPDAGPTLPVYGNGTGAKTGDIPAGYILHLVNAGDHWQIINQYAAGGDGGKSPLVVTVDREGAGGYVADYNSSEILAAAQAHRAVIMRYTDSGSGLQTDILLKGEKDGLPLFYDTWLSKDGKTVHRIDATVDYNSNVNVVQSSVPTSEIKVLRSTSATNPDNLRHFTTAEIVTRSNLGKESTWDSTLLQASTFADLTVGQMVWIAVMNADTRVAGYIIGVVSAVSADSCTTKGAGYVDGVPRELDLSGYVKTSSVGVASGVASLGADGKVPAGQLPDIGGAESEQFDGVLQAAQWLPDKTYRYIDSRITGNINDTAYVVAPAANVNNIKAYVEAGIFCKIQGTNILGFVCDTVPSVDIDISVLKVATKV